MKIKVLTPGLLTTVQDLGRPGWRSSGVPLSGAADTTSHRLANFLVGNEAGAASLEIAGGRFSAQTEQAGWLAAGGKGGQFLIDKKEMDYGRLYFVPKGAMLEIRPGPESNYAYLAVPGGWDVPEVLGSKSTCLAAGFGGLDGRGLQKGDILKSVDSPDEFGISDSAHSGKIWAGKWFVRDLPFRKLPSFEKFKSVIRVLPGPESHWWSEVYQEEFFKTPFIISARRDRMGVRFDIDQGAPTFQKLNTFGKLETMLSTAVGPGAIQMPPDGQPVALLADAQTTGGYPRIAQVIAVDIPRLAQIPSGQTVYFQKVTLEEAEQLFFEHENMMRKIQLALRINK
ncbi:MAG TPA: biotin-dependent carboxyltransferase family protein [Saprospiraceae bacterium]|nr:biotin-dependent carboxyltransferase family protein [Saprospiraceae bacterium]